MIPEHCPTVGFIWSVDVDGREVGVVEQGVQRLLEKDCLLLLCSFSLL